LKENSETYADTRECYSTENMYEINCVYEYRDDDDDDDDVSVHFSISLFFLSFIAPSVYTRCTKINYKTVPETNFNKYSHYGTSGNE